MGTRSRIGIELPDHSVVSVYCHYDGYVEGNGRELVEHFNTKEKVQELINGGDMSSLYTTHMWESAPLKQIIMKKDDDGKEYREVKYMTDDKNQWIYSPVKESPAPLYYSERGEDAPPKMTTFDEFLSGDCGEEYAYMYDLNGTWKAYKLPCYDSKVVERVDIPGYVVL